MIDKRDVLKNYFGFDNFRTGQEEIIDSLLRGCDILGVMPTGSGKSICYQIPAVIFEGITIVISPLISLMKDQVSNANAVGLKACYINSTQTFDEQNILLNDIIAGKFKIIYVTPERLSTSYFMSVCQMIHISMVTVDEAHCVSQWGQDFRQSYLNIANFIEQLPVRPVVGAFTATATVQVKNDICNLLKLQNPKIITTGFDRPNLYFAVKKPDDKFKELFKFLKIHGKESGIIYCNTRKNVEIVANRLQKCGFNVKPYHAGLSDEERNENQEDFIYDRVNIIVATNAFGMGIDKSDVTFVVHYNMPKDIESYYQEAGRAGRDGSESICVLYYSYGDYRTNLFLLTKTFEDGNCTKEIFENNVKKLNLMQKYATTKLCLRHSMISYFGDVSSVYCGKCSNCLENFKDFDATIQAQKILSCIYRIQEKKKITNKATVISILNGNKDDKIEQNQFDKLSTYGIMKDEPLDRTKQIFDELINCGYVNKNQYFNNTYVTLNVNCKNVLTGKEKFNVKLPKNLIKSSKSQKLVNHSEDKYYNVESNLSEDDKKLLKQLKLLRINLSEIEKVPVYVIFTNKTLIDICKIKPTTIKEFENVPSIGKLKSKKYGEDVIKTIKKFIKK